MNKLKKFFTATLITALLACLFLLSAGGCKKDDSVKNEFVVYGEETITVSGKKGNDITFPDDPTREGFIFDGWYTDASFAGSPVTSGKFDGETTYYAKWEVGCLIVLQPEGGTLSTDKVYVRAGTPVLSAVADYVPEKGDLVFGGWFVGDKELTSDVVATVNGLTLTAKYKAKFVINGSVENLDGDYENKANFVEGYAFVGDNLEPYAVKDGFTAEDAAEFTVDADSTKNVFEVSFSRNRYNYEVYEYYPDGSFTRTAQRRYYYESEVALPTGELSFEGYRFIGWATRNGASYGEALSGDKIKITGDVALYPVWDRGYSDMFGGSDYLFIDYERENGVILRRGGIDIPGEYDEDYEMYFFYNGDNVLTLKITLDQKSYRFIFYATRGGTYYLWDTSKSGNDKENIQVSITLDNINGITYDSSVDGDRKILRGTYEITDDGMYAATLKDALTGVETTMTFLLGQSSYSNHNVFRIRGEEYRYGTLARRLMYYPLVTLDGFGNATLTTSTQTAAFFYEKVGDVVTMVSASNETIVIKIKNFDGKIGYDVYDKDFDTVMYCESPAHINATLTLDGCNGVTYAYGNETYTGTFTLTDSLFGGSIITVTAQNADGTTTKHVYRYYDKKIGGQTVAKMFVDCGNDYAEHYFVDDSGNIKNNQLFVIDGGKGYFYEVKDTAAKTFELASVGTIALDDEGFCVYTATKTEDWASVQSATRVIGSFNTGNYLVYFLAEEDGEKAASTTDYMTGDGETVTIIATKFGVYTDKDGKTVIGLVSKQDTYLVVTDGSKYYYFAYVDGSANMITPLENAPLVLTKRTVSNGSATTDSKTKLTLTGKKTGDNLDSIYAVTDGDGNVTTTYGVSRAENLVYPGLNVTVYTFVSNDNTVSFKYVVTSSETNYGTRYYFNYYALSETITFATIQSIDDGDLKNDSITLAFTDEKTSDGKLVLVYNDGTNTYKGTFDTREVIAEDGTKSVVAGHTVDAFGVEEYRVTAYSFDSLDGEHDFEFTLLSSRFRISAEDATYTNASGEKLELDGATHVVRYTDKNGNQSYSYYVISEGVLEENGKAVVMSVGETSVIFDVTSDNKFARRGAEAGNYIIIENGARAGVYISLDGQGKAKITYADETKTEKDATYVVSGETYSVIADNEVLYVGKLGVWTSNGTDYNAFRLEMENCAGAYLNEDDLSVIVLDDAGNATRYSSYGVREIGYYYMIDDGVFYYSAKDLTDAAMYHIDGRNVKTSDFFASYYAADFASIVFYANGIVRYNYTTDKFYTYDEAADSGKIYTLAPDDTNANAYGYVFEEFSLKDSEGKFASRSYDDGKKARTYSYFDGKYIIFTAEDGSTLEFQPTGLPTFTVVGKHTTYKTENETTTVDTEVNYLVALTYTNDGEPYIYLGGYYQNRNVNGSIYNSKSYTFTYTANYDLTIDYDKKTFSFTPKTFKRGFAAYNYQYAYYASALGSKYAALYAQYYGIMQIVENIVDENNSYYTVSGGFAFLPELDADGKPVIENGQTKLRTFTFTDGKMSKAGYYRNRYGHMFTAEFVVDEETYHMTFYLMPTNTSSNYVFQIAYISKVTKAVTLDAENDTVFFEEQLIYTAVRVQKGTDAEGKAVYYEVGDEFVPSLRYNGEIVCAYNTELEDGVWKISSQVFACVVYPRYVQTSYDYHYEFTPTLDDEGNVTGGTVTRTQFVYAKDSAGNTVYFLHGDDYNVKEVICIVFDGETDPVYATACVKTGDLTFEVTFGDKTYVITFTQNTDADGKVTGIKGVTVTEKTAEDGGESAGE